MARPPKPDVLADVDHVVRDAAPGFGPWATEGPEFDSGARVYCPDYSTLRSLLAVPIAKGHAQKQQSGRVAKSLDAYVAYELRRAGFDANNVFPRATQPRVVPPGGTYTREAIAEVIAAVAEVEAGGERLKPRRLRDAIMRLDASSPGQSETGVLGRFYKKQVDAVVLSDWLQGPDVLVSGKTQFSSYLNNKNNRYEEAIGEARNLRDRYPLTAMGFAYVVRSNVFEGGAFELLRDLLVRLRAPDGPFDATVLLVADWDDSTLVLRSVEDPATNLALPRFFADLLDAVMTNTPVDVHQSVRQAKLGDLVGELPPSEDD